MLAREYQLTARGKGVNAREYVLASVKFKSNGTVAGWQTMQVIMRILLQTILLALFS